MEGIAEHEAEEVSAGSQAHPQDERDQAFNGVYKTFVVDPAPARSTFAVKELPRGARVEVEAIAARS
jgi:enamine deaminase RidA (YjgF/YER057c/UK114 family)